MKLNPLLLLAASGALALGACHTTESNYRAAYDVAKARTKSAERQLDPEVQAQLDRAEKRRQTVYIIGPDTLHVQTWFLAREDSAGAPIPEFSVAVNGFEQRFNALAMMRRLRENGLPEAYVVKNATPTFFVIAAATDSAAALPALIQQAADKTASLGLAKGYPKVLRNPNRKK